MPIIIHNSHKTYSTGTATSSGITKLYTSTGSATDGTMTQSAITTALNGKATSGHTHNYAGASSSGGSATSALKLSTARTIELNGLSSGSVSFDGSNNATITNWGYGWSKTVTSSTADKPYIRIATTESKSNYYDASIVFVIDSGYQGGGFGVVKVCCRTNDISKANQSTCEVIWLVRQGFSANQLFVKGNAPSGDTQYFDLYFKASGTYNGATITVLSSCARGVQSRKWTFQNDAARAAADTRKYTFTTEGSDVGSVKSASSSSKANGLNDTNNNSTITAAYSKSGLAYADYSWLTAWNGYELRAVAKSQFATADHSHNLNTMINGLSTGTSAPQDADYYICQYAGGGTATTTYHRRPHSALWSYIKGKTDSIYSVKSHTHNSTTDINDSKATTFAYSKAALDYNNFTYLAAWNGYELRAINKSAFATAGHTHKYAGSSSVGGSANSAKELDCIQCTANSNVTGWRLIATKSIASQWCNYRSVFSIRSRHQGAGILCVSCGNNSDTISQKNAYAEIKYFGLTDSGNVVASDSFYFYISADGKTAYLFMKGYDYSDLYINKLNGDIDISNGAWMTSIASTYGSLKASTQINVATSATSLTSSAGSATQPIYFSNGKPVACTYTLSKSVPSNAVFTDTNTWRGIQNNLTSDSTSDSLSAAQGKALKGLIDGKASSSHTHKYAGASSSGGSATSAVKLDTSTAGSATQPVYFSGGKPVACTYTLGKSVPSDAKFTDTNTWRGVQNNLTSTATDQSLSAAQGKVLKGLVDGKANSNHTHSYLPLSGGTLSGSISPSATKSLSIGANEKRFYTIFTDMLDACGSICLYNDEIGFEAAKLYTANKNKQRYYGSLRFSVDSIGIGGDMDTLSTIVVLPEPSATGDSYLRLPPTNGTIQVSSSDARMKQNINDTEINDALSLINSIKLHSFDWKKDKSHQKIGVIADELEILDKKLVLPGDDELDDNGLPIYPKGVDTFYLQGYEVKAIQELSEKNNQLENTIRLLKSKIESLENKIK